MQDLYLVTDWGGEGGGKKDSYSIPEVIMPLLLHDSIQDKVYLGCIFLKKFLSLF